MIFPFFLLSLALTATLTVLCKLSGLSLLWIALMLPGFTLGFILLHFIIICIMSLFINKNKEQKTNNKFFRRLTTFSIGIVLKLMRVKVVCQNAHLIPEGRWLLISNHRSGFDPLIQMWALRKHDIAFISKPENLRIPVGGEFMHKCGALAIDRDNPRKALRVILKAVDYIKNDIVSVCIYPEGTRNHEGGVLPFKSGALQIAQKAKAPIVCSVVHNSQNITKNLPFKRTVVTVRILSVIDAASAADQKTVDIGEVLRKEISDAWYELEDNTK